MSQTENTNIKTIEVVTGYELITDVIDRGILENNPDLCGQSTKIPVRTITHTASKEVCFVDLNEDPSKNVLLGNAILALRGTCYPKECLVAYLNVNGVKEFYGYPDVEHLHDETVEVIRTASKYLEAIAEEVESDTVRVRYFENQLTVEWDVDLSKDIDGGMVGVITGSEFKEGNTYFMVGYNVHTMDPDYQAACEYISRFREAVAPH